MSTRKHEVRKRLIPAPLLTGAATLSLGSLLFGSCGPNQRSGSPSPDASAALESVLTNQGRGKYWDEVYSTDVYGRIVPAYPPAGPSRRSVGPYDCSYFAPGGVAIHYHNLDSIRVLDRHKTPHLKYTDQFRVSEDSTIFFAGQSRKILALTKDVLVIEYRHQHFRGVTVYMPSTYQAKVIVPYADSLAYRFHLRASF